MPELPEVEVLRRQLETTLSKGNLVEVSFQRQSSVFLTPPRVLREKLLGHHLVELTRRGKYLLFYFDDRSRLMIHLGMTGQLLVVTEPGPTQGLTDKAPANAPFLADRHTHLHLRFHDPAVSLYFRDPRRFGRVLWLAPGQSSPRLERLGPDALRLDAATLHAALHRRYAALKTLLLDQSLVAGVGNIYADEALFRAKLHPELPGHDLTLAMTKRLVSALHVVLETAIAKGGSSIRDYVHSNGQTGEFQLEHLVYGRAGEPCRRCGRPIERHVLNQRSSHFCPHCQAMTSRHSADSSTKRKRAPSVPR